MPGMATAISPGTTFGAVIGVPVDNLQTGVAPGLIAPIVTGAAFRTAKWNQ